MHSSLEYEDVVTEIMNKLHNRYCKEIVGWEKPVSVSPEGKYTTILVWARIRLMLDKINWHG